MDKPPPTYETLAEAIGHIVIDWNYLESLVKALVYDLATYHSGAFEEDEEFHVLFVMLGNSDLRDDVATAKALAHDVDDPGFYERVETVLNPISNELRNERHRFVHDVWQLTGSKIKRVKSGVAVKKEPASGNRVLSMQTTKEYTSLKELGDFHLAIFLATQQVDGLIVELNRIIAS